MVWQLEQKILMLSRMSLKTSTTSSQQSCPHCLADAFQNELKNFDYIITKELSTLSGCLALRCGRLLALANAFLITAKYVDLSSKEPHHPSRDADGYQLAGLDEVPTAE